MAKTTRTGKAYEKEIYKSIHDTLGFSVVAYSKPLNDCVVCKEAKVPYVHSHGRITTNVTFIDIYNRTCSMDALYKNLVSGATLCIEIKCQTTPGSVDQKYPYYVECVRQGCYPAPLAFVMKTPVLTRTVIPYLIRTSQILPIRVVYQDHERELARMLV